MSVKKQNLVDLDSGEKSRITKVSVVTLALVAIVCCILVGCFACSQNRPAVYRNVGRAEDNLLESHGR